MDASAGAPDVLTVGAADPAGEVGVLADTRAVIEAGCMPLAVITGVLTTVNGTATSVPVSSQVVGDQLRVIRERRLAAIKVGVMADADSVRVVAEEAAGRGVPVVADPDLGAFSLEEDREWIAAYRDSMLPAVTVLVVDAAEGALLAGRGATAASLVRALVDEGARWVVVKGRTADKDQHEDVVSDGSTWFAVRSARVPVAARGAGDLYSAALAARLARGKAVPEAASEAREQVVSHLRQVRGRT